MFRRTIEPYGTPRKPRIWDWFYPSGLGAILLSFVIHALWRGQFKYRRSGPITASDHPIFFWTYVLFLLFGSLLLLRAALADFRAWRRAKRSIDKPI